MQATITINLDNAAFEAPQGNELARILLNLAHKISNVEFGVNPYDDQFMLRDINGNKVGSFVVTTDSTSSS